MAQIGPSSSKSSAPLPTRLHQSFEKTDRVSRRETSDEEQGDVKVTRGLVCGRSWLRSVPEHTEHARDDRPNRKSDRAPHRRAGRNIAPEGSVPKRQQDLAIGARQAIRRPDHRGKRPRDLRGPTNGLQNAAEGIKRAGQLAQHGVREADCEPGDEECRNSVSQEQRHDAEVTTDAPSQDRGHHIVSLGLTGRGTQVARREPGTSQSKQREAVRDDERRGERGQIPPPPSVDRREPIDESNDPTDDGQRQANGAPVDSARRRPSRTPRPSGQPQSEEEEAEPERPPNVEVANP